MSACRSLQQDMNQKSIAMSKESGSAELAIDLTQDARGIPRLNRRGFLKRSLATGALGALSGSMLSTATLAQSGSGYEDLETPLLTRDGDSIEVLEFFWFGCPHCYAFEPAINRWAERKPEYVSFVREAPPLNPSWEQHSRAFYAAEALKVSEGFFEPMFDRIHKDRKPMRDPSRIAAFAQELDLGVSAERFANTMKSFSVETALRRSTGLAQQARISGVPSIVINGKYRTGSSLAGGHQGMINVIDKLVAQEHSAS